MTAKGTGGVKDEAKAPSSQGGAQSVQRAMSLLRAVAEQNKRGARLSPLARKVGLHVATARRLLQVLAEEGVVTYDPVTKLYHLGLELFRLGSQAQQYAIRNRFHPALERIAKETQDTVFLLIRLGNDVLCADMIQGEYPIRTILVNVGSRRPLGIGAGSLAMIAFSDPEDFERVVTANAPRYSQFQGRSEKEIRAMATKALKDGYVFSDGLFHKDAASVGVPVLDQDGKVICAVTVSAIRARMSAKRRKQIVQLVKEQTRPEIVGL
ncbi:MAG: IclR family transcriptional regulator [Proteobacteria bacterium]|nr:IclR family transcriptional regulator [Pseudomonadota bacterium]MBU1451472.1 IclR family transcriptional regulator [Pseudomonadota bacterium]MBU2470493.1 IclR family transcriptional regulator [Pseudomonadota bacterium]MBU2516401.1 IclR family transcriptional regulator [Pseudomonadota bacterium]